MRDHGTTRQSPWLASVFLAAFALGVAGLTERQSLGARTKPTVDFHAAVVNGLRDAEYTRDISCEQFSDLVLRDAGLPDLGKDGTIEGSRGDLDRRGQFNQPPTFLDSVISSRPPHQELRVKAFVVPPTQDVWLLELIRRKSGATQPDMTTRFEFRVAPINNHPSCDLLWIDILTPDKEASGRYDMNRCLDLFDPARPAPKDPGLDSLVEKDCLRGLRYFEAIKWRAKK